jgi:hypothetical protein
VSDELDARIRALEAERLRPVPPPPQLPAVALADYLELCRAIGDDDEPPRTAIGQDET